MISRLYDLQNTKYQTPDIPVFVDVSFVISQYVLEGEIDFSASRNNSDFIGNTQSLGGRGTYTDRPTITYAPMVGEKFSRSLTKPIPPSAIFFLIQAGYPVDFVFRTFARSPQ